jgi:hypothetical protein
MKNVEKQVNWVAGLHLLEKPDSFLSWGQMEHVVAAIRPLKDGLSVNVNNFVLEQTHVRDLYSDQEQ